MSQSTFLIRRMTNEEYMMYLKAYNGSAVSMAEPTTTPEDTKWVSDIVSRGYRGTHAEIRKNTGKSWWAGTPECWTDSNGRHIFLDGKKAGDEDLLMKFMASSENAYYALKWKNGWKELLIETQNVAVSYPISLVDLEGLYELVTLLSLRRSPISAVAVSTAVTPAPTAASFQWATGTR